jgi:hypothetical protein
MRLHIDHGEAQAQLLYGNLAPAWLCDPAWFLLDTEADGNSKFQDGDS